MKLLPLFLCLALGLTPAAPAVASSQPPEEAAAEPWYAQAQTYTREMGLMTGSYDGFFPNEPVTRATVLQTLYNREGRPGASQAPSPWFSDAVAWAAENGLAETFTEDAVITRAEVKALLDGYCAWKGADSTGLMVGDGSGELELEQDLTRAQLAQLLYRLDTLAPRCAEEVVNLDVAEQDGIPAHAVPGTLCTPVDTEGQKFPAVVMLHSTNSNRDENAKSFKLAAALMAQRGIVSLRIDFMGYGDSTAKTTDYNFTSANLDTKAAADYLASLDCVDPEKTAVLGWSQGGTNALLAAAEYPGTFQAVITWAGAVNLKSLLPNFDVAYELSKFNGGIQGERWFREVNETNVSKAIMDLKIPVLAINGTQDTMVPEYNARTIANLAQDGTLLIIPGANHTFNVYSGNLGPLFEMVNAGIDFLHEKLDVNSGVSR